MSRQIKFKQWNCALEFGKYGNGRTAITLRDTESHEVIAVASVNLPDEPLEADQVFIKNYSENEGMLDALIQAGVVSPTGEVVRSGFVEIPKCVFV